MSEEYSVDVAEWSGARHREIAVPTAGHADRGEGQSPLGSALRDRCRSVGISGGGGYRAHLGNERLVIGGVHRCESIAHKRDRSFCGCRQLTHNRGYTAAQRNPGDTRLHLRRAQDRFVFLLAQAGHHGACHCRERGGERDFEHWQSPVFGRCQQVQRHGLVRKPRSETQSRYFCGGQSVDVLGVVGGARGHQSKPGSEDQLAAGKPGSGVCQLGGLRKRHWLRRRTAVSQQFQREVPLE